MAHYAVAVALDVIEGNILHCIYTHFLKGDYNKKQKVTYKVINHNISRIFTLYAVQATQNEKALILATVSFHKNNSVL